VSIRFKFTVATLSENEGAYVGIFVDSRLQENALAFSTFVNTYSKKMMMYDVLYVAENFKENFTNITLSTTTEQVLYKEYDIKSHRLLRNLDETLLLQIIGLGNVSLEGISFTQSTLVRLPR